MITRPALWRQTERRLQAKTARTAAEARRAFEALYRYARRLRALPRRNPLEGLDTDLRLAEALRRLGSG